MKKAVLVIILLAILGVAASLWLIPGAGEMALMNLRDKKYDEALVVYQGELDKGNSTPEVVGRTVDLYLKAGKIDEAIGVMEKFLGENPNNVSAMERLGTLYQYAQRPDDYMKNLERINKIAPSEKNQQILANLYNANGDHAKQLEIMLTLVEMDKTKTPDYYRDIANLQAARKAYPEAIATLRAFRAQYPNEFTFAQAELLVSLLLDDKKSDEALAAAREWAKKNPPPEEIARLTNVLHYKGAPAQALAFIDPYKEQAKTNTDLLTELAAVYVTLGQKDEAYALLHELHNQKKLPPILFGSYLELLVARGDMEEVQAFVEQIDPMALTESQAVFLVELADTTHNPVLLKTINARFGDATYLETRPVFAAVLALANRDPKAADAIARAEAVPELLNEQLAQLAQACARANQNACALRNAEKLAAREGLTDTDVANIGEIYLIAGEYGRGLTYIGGKRTEANAGALNPVWAKLSVGAGKTDEVATWLETYKTGETDRQLLRDLYFLALENGQAPFAVAVAELMAEKEPSAENKRYLGTAYVRNGQYADAVPLLRDTRGDSDADESMYLEALINAGNENAELKSELEEYLVSRLEDKKLSDKRKQQLLYVLIDSGRADLALPYIHDYALKRGGSWASLYENTLVKQGRKAELRDFWLTIAQGKSTPAKRKREVAFSLLNAGYKADAVMVFQSLASNAPADSADTQQLLYLWGPRPTPEAMSWVEQRSAAARGADQVKWLEILAGYGANDAIVQIAQANPEVTTTSKGSRIYLEALGATLEKSDNPGALKAELEKRIASENDAQTLNFYAELAQRHYLTPTARAAYEKLYVLDPKNAEVNRKLGILAFTQADYSAARQHLSSFAANRGKSEKDDYIGFFYLAESLNHDRDRVEAQKYYFRTLEEIGNSGVKTVESQSVAAQARFRTGDVEGAYAAFEDLIAKNPGNRILRADYASALVEGKRYEKAREVIAADRGENRQLAANKAPSRALLLDGKSVRNVAVSRDGREAVITLNRPAEKMPALAKLAKNTPEYLNYATIGYDQALLVAADGTKLDAAQTATGVEIVATQAPAQTSAQLASQTTLRMELLSARIELETGDQDLATERLANLQQRYPSDPQLLGYAANAEYYTGRWVRARNLVNQAQVLAPENEDIAILNRDIERVYGQQVKLDHEWRMYGDNDEQITTLSGRIYLQPEWTFGFALQNNFVDSVLLQRSDGRIGEFSETKQRGALTLAHDTEDGAHIQGALYGNNDTAGAGFEYGIVNSFGITTLGLDYHRPYWEFPEAVLADTTRDRIGVSHVAKIDPTLTISGNAGYNIYNVDIEDDVVQTANLNFNVIKAFQNDPWLAVGYGFDGEYQIQEDQVTRAPFGTYTPLQFPSREVHSLSLLGRYDFSTETYAGGSLGYAYDRFGGNGPVGEFYVNHIFADNFEGGFRAYHGLGIGDTNEDLTRIGAHLMLRF